MVATPVPGELLEKNDSWIVEQIRIGCNGSGKRPLAWHGRRTVSPHVLTTGDPPAAFHFHFGIAKFFQIELNMDELDDYTGRLLAGDPFNFNHNNNNEELGSHVSVDADPSGPREFLVEMRRRAHKTLQAQSDDGMTLEHLIRTTRALITHNEEIWGRCKRYYCPGKVATDETSRVTNCTNFMFARLAHSTIKARTTECDNNTLVFKSALEVTKKSFHLPVAIPSPLNRLVVVPRHTKDAVLPNCLLVLKRSMVLSDEILVLFLMEFKDFLETLQVALGEVDAWLLEAWKCKIFLQRYFGKNKAFGPAADSSEEEKYDIYSSDKRCSSLLKATKCSRCGEHFVYHNKITRAGCASSWRNCSSKTNVPGYFPVSPGSTLLHVELPGGNIDVNFCIDQVEDRKRLIKFLSFAVPPKSRSQHDEEE